MMPGFFMSNIPGGMFRPMPPANNWTFALPIPSTTPMPLFNTADTGKWIKAIVLHREQLLGARVLAATAYVMPDEIVEQFKAVFPEAGATAAFYETPHKAFLDAMCGMGLPEYAAEEMLENMRLMNEGGYYGGKELDESHAVLEDKLTTWKEYIKGAKPFAELK